MANKLNKIKKNSWKYDHINSVVSKYFQEGNRIDPSYTILELYQRIQLKPGKNRRRILLYPDGFYRLGKFSYRKPSYK